MRSNGSTAAGNAVDLNPMEFIEQNGTSSNHTSNGGNSNGHHMPPPPPFELDFDKFDMLSEFPDLDHYNTTSQAGAMIHHGASGPLLSSAINAQHAQQHQKHRITDYSPDWAWSEVSLFQIRNSTRHGHQCKEKNNKVFALSEPHTHTLYFTIYFFVF